MSRRRWRDEELEGFLRETLWIPDEEEASPAVVAAVMQRMQAEGRRGMIAGPAAEGGVAASPLNSLAFALAAGLALGWAGTSFWTALSPGFASLVNGVLGQLAGASLRWVFQGLTEAARALLFVGLGDLFPLLLLGTLFLTLLAADRPKRAGR